MNKEEPKKKNEEKPKEAEKHEEPKMQYQPVGGSHVPAQQPGQQTSSAKPADPSFPPDSQQQQVMTALNQVLQMLLQIKTELLTLDVFTQEHFSGAGGYQQPPQPGSFGQQSQTGGGKSY
jgi:outer membrane biosynthesis protein TonB